MVDEITKLLPHFYRLYIADYLEENGDLLKAAVLRSNLASVSMFNEADLGERTGKGNLYKAEGMGNGFGDGFGDGNGMGGGFGTGTGFCERNHKERYYNPSLVFGCPTGDAMEPKR